MTDIIAGYLIYSAVIPLMMVFASNFQWGFQWINPIVIYDNVPVNWFGCIVLTILAHIVAGPIWAGVYWLYKLCTVGRE